MKSVSDSVSGFPPALFASPSRKGLFERACNSDSNLVLDSLARIEQAGGTYEYALVNIQIMVPVKKASNTRTWGGIIRAIAKIYKYLYSL